jgi:phosphomannomutase
MEKNQKNFADSATPMIGLAQDGDADRIGVVDTTGEFITPNELGAILLWYRFNIRNERGPVSKTIVTSHLMTDLADRYGLPWEEVETGFKNFTKYMKVAGSENPGLVLLEESAHVGLGDIDSWDDAMLVGLMTAEIVAKTGKNLSAIRDEIYKELGYKYFFKRSNVEVSKEEHAMIKSLMDTQKNTIKACLDAILPQDKVVIKTDERGGMKFWFKDGSWLSVRVSGTEPVEDCILKHAGSRMLQKCRNWVADLLI